MNKKQIVFIHGGTAFTRYEAFLEYLRTKPIEDPLNERKEKRWQTTLSETLGDTHEVYFPAMPNNRNAQYTEWKMWFERYFQFLREEVILVGHSLGGYFLAKYLSENKMPVSVQGLFLLAAPFHNDDFGGEDGGDFAFDPKNLGSLTAQVRDIHILHSKDDPVVPYTHALMYKEVLPKAQLHTFIDKNHFILEEFPELIAQIRAV